MPLKPVFENAPLTNLTQQPLRCGLARVDSAILRQLYSICGSSDRPEALEGAFRLACLVTAQPLSEPVCQKIRAAINAQQPDGAFQGSFVQQIAILRAGWALYEMEGRKPVLDHLAMWFAWAAKHWDELMADEAVWANAADLMEMLENMYRVTGKAAMLSLYARAADQTMAWSGTLNTLSAQRPSSLSVTAGELENGLSKEGADLGGYYHQFLRSATAWQLADGARATLAKGLYSGSATELSAARNAWERLVRHHGAICGGLTSDELLEGTSPAKAVSTAAIGAWAEALSRCACGVQSAWVWEPLERMLFNAMPAAVSENGLRAFQHVNVLADQVDKKNLFRVAAGHDLRAADRLSRGFSAAVSAAVTATPDGMSINLYLPGKYAVHVGDQIVVLTVSAEGDKFTVSFACKEPCKAALSLRIPTWSRNTEVAVNGMESDGIKCTDNMMRIERTWENGNTVTISMEQAVTVCEAHHQGRYVMRGPHLMALPACETDYAWALAGASADGRSVAAQLDAVSTWRHDGAFPADVPVLPATENAVCTRTLTHYAHTPARIALFAGRNRK